MALITKGITMTWDKTKNAGRPTALYIENAFPEGNVLPGDFGDFAPVGGVFTFHNLQEIGEISMTGAGSSGYDQIEVTTLADHKHKYVDGLLADDSTGANEITMKFLFSPALFTIFKEIIKKEGAEDIEIVGSAEEITDENKQFISRNSIYTITIPGGGKFEVEGTFSNLKMDTSATNSALTFTVGLNVADIEYSYQN